MSETTAPNEQTPAESGTEYTPPATQADLDRIIADRLSRERAKFADYDDLKAAAGRLEEIEEANKTEAEKQADLIATLKAKVEDFETRDQITKWKADVAESTGVPVNVLAGNTLEEIQAHAETLKPFIAESNTPPKPAPLIVPAEGTTPPALNSSALEDALRKAVGAQ